MDAAKYVIRSRLNTTNYLGRAVTTSLLVWRHAWMRSTGFSGDVQEVSALFGEKVDSVLGVTVDTRGV